jgi:hypothetical protein
MATRLQPLLQFCVKEKNEPASSLFNNESRTSEVRLGTCAEKRVVIRTSELGHPNGHRSLGEIIGFVVVERVDQDRQVV